MADTDTGTDTDNLLLTVLLVLACGGLIRLNPRNNSQKNVVVKSPHFPQLYHRNSNCFWSVVSTNTLLSARITVNVLHTENRNDIVKIYDSLESDAAIHTYSGRLQSVVRREVQNSPGLNILFKSDSNTVAEKGFKLTIATKIGNYLYPMAL